MKRILYLTILACIAISCGNNKSKSQGTIQIVLTDKTIQREVYGVSLGESYSYDELVTVLSNQIENLTSKEDRNFFASNPYLSTISENHFVHYYVSTSSYFRGFLFGNNYWDSFSLEASEDDRIYNIRFSDSDQSTTSQEYQYQQLLQKLVEKYGEPNMRAENGNCTNTWFDGNTFLNLDISHYGERCHLSIEYVDNAIINEVYEQQMKAASNEL